MYHIVKRGFPPLLLFMAFAVWWAGWLPTAVSGLSSVMLRAAGAFYLGLPDWAAVAVAVLVLALLAVALVYESAVSHRLENLYHDPIRAEDAYSRQVAARLAGLCLGSHAVWFCGYAYLTGDGGLASWIALACLSPAVIVTLMLFGRLCVDAFDYAVFRVVAVIAAVNEAMRNARMPPR